MADSQPESDLRIFRQLFLTKGSLWEFSLANGISDAVAANFGRIAQRAGIRVREVEACVRQSPRLLAAAADGCTPFVQWEAFCTVATIDYLFPCGFPYP
jgi:hypothetical protein